MFAFDFILAAHDSYFDNFLVNQHVPRQILRQRQVIGRLCLRASVARLLEHHLIHLLRQLPACSRTVLHRLRAHWRHPVEHTFMGTVLFEALMSLNSVIVIISVTVWLTGVRLRPLLALWIGKLLYIHFLKDVEQIPLLLLVILYVLRDYWVLAVQYAFILQINSRDGLQQAGALDRRVVLFRLYLAAIVVAAFLIGRLLLRKRVIRRANGIQSLRNSVSALRGTNLIPRDTLHPVVDRRRKRCTHLLGRWIIIRIACLAAVLNGARLENGQRFLTVHDHSLIGAVSGFLLLGPLSLIH